MVTAVCRFSCGLAMTCAVVLLYAVNPAESRVYPPCPFRALTGLYCPGCGSLRALHQLLHGELCAAMGLNPLAVACIPVLCLLAAFPGWRNRPWVCWSALVVLVAYGILRNVPLWPCSCLAPH